MKAHWERVFLEIKRVLTRNGIFWILDFPLPHSRILERGWGEKGGGRGRERGGERDCYIILPGFDVYYGSLVQICCKTEEVVLGQSVWKAEHQLLKSKSKIPTIIQQLDYLWHVQTIKSMHGRDMCAPVFTLASRYLSFLQSKVLWYLVLNGYSDTWFWMGEAFE